MDAILLARVQFAANITFHILFPTLSIVLGWLLLFFKLRYRASGDRAWIDLYRFWVKVFALSFALGVVSGITMSFQFGTNWPGFMNTVGNIAGPLLAYEVLTAFFMEATFLAIMLFGVGRVSDRVHTLATALVCIGTTLSAFWILALNSWMHTPEGFEMRDGVAHVLSWIDVIFNPSLPYRLTHMLMACGLTGAFLLAGLSAYRHLRGDQGRDVQLGLRVGVALGAVLVPLQVLVGDLHGLNTLEHQPAKIAAMEGLWETQARAPAILFALPDEDAQVNRYEVAIPGLASLYLRHDLDAEIQGLKDFEQAPRMTPVFWAFRVMVGTGLLMWLVAWTSAWQLWRRGELSRWGLRALVWMSFSGWVAVVAGWYVTEIGRQPWLVHGVLTTADAASDVAPTHIALSLVLYLSLYLFLVAAFISVLFYLAGKGVPRDIPATGAALEVAR